MHPVDLILCILIALCMFSACCKGRDGDRPGRRHCSGRLLGEGCHLVLKEVNNGHT